jgi:hypothetical protein
VTDELIFWLWGMAMIGQILDATEPKSLRHRACATLSIVFYLSFLACKLRGFLK